MAKQSPWVRRMGRLRSMSADELVDRARQYSMARIDAWRSHRGYDFAGQVPDERSGGRFFFSPAEIRLLSTVLWQQFPTTVSEIVARAQKICRHEFDLLGYESLDFGADIDWHLDPVHGKRAPRRPWFKINYLDFEEVGDAKITWELNRHQHLVTLAKAYRLTDDDSFVREILAQWSHWHAENPYPIGINWASSLEVALRTLSWVWVYFLLEGTPAMTPDLRRQWVRALSVSGRHIETYLSTYFSPNTHLLGEAVALYFLGVLFPNLPPGARRKERCWTVILDCAQKQVREDGFYFEQSTYYHVYAVDCFLHARTLAAANNTPIPEEFDRRLLKMLDALGLMGRAGVLPLIGDDDGGRLFDPRRNRTEYLMDPLVTGAVVFKRGDFKFFGPMREETLWLLGAAGLRVFEELKTGEPSSESKALSESGFYLMADAETGQQLMIDAGPHGPGHGHADALSLTLARNGRMQLLDPGTCEYVGDDEVRARYRGTAAHNTLRVDGMDQAEGVVPFAWSKPPAIKVDRWVAGHDFKLFLGSHDGYARLPQPVQHERWVFHRKGQFWLVRDVASGEGKHSLELNWHLGPTLSTASTKDNLFSDGPETLGFVTAEGHGWAQSAHRGSWSPVYGREERAMVLTFSTNAKLPAEFVTLLVPDANPHSGLGRLENVAHENGVRDLRYAREAQEHHFFFSNDTRPWTLGSWSSDARFLYWAWDRSRDARMLVLCGGSYAEIAGIRVIRSEVSVNYAEIVSASGKTELFSNDADRVVLEASLERLEMELAVLGNDLKKTGV